MKDLIYLSFLQVYIHQCGMGIAHSIFIARVDTEDEKKAIEKYDILDQSALDK
jgi:hypothetical protein